MVAAPLELQFLAAWIDGPHATAVISYPALYEACQQWVLERRGAPLSEPLFDRALKKAKGVNGEPLFLKVKGGGAPLHEHRGRHGRRWGADVLSVRGWLQGMGIAPPPPPATEPTVATGGVTI